MSLTPTESYLYRVVECGDGWEPQMSYTAGMIKGTFWFPLNAEGYWLEPEAFSHGNPTKRSIMTKDAAERAILRAQAIEGRHIRPLT